MHRPDALADEAIVVADSRVDLVQSKIGMAVKAALGDAGFELWDAWSSTGTKYDASEMRSQWRSFQAEGGITAGTLFHFAKQHGWQQPRAQRHQR